MWAVFQIVLVLLAGLLYLIAIFITLQYVRISRTPRHIPCVGVESSNSLARIRACLNEFIHKRATAAEGYEKFSKHNKAFVLPGLQWSTIVLPPCDASWIASQPDHSLSTAKVLNDLTGFDYLSEVERIHDFTVITRDLTRRMGATLPEVLDELVVSLDELLVTDAENWKEIKLVRTLSDISFRMISRMFVGLPLARDKGFAQAVQHWMVAFGVTSAMMKYLVPYPLKSWIMPALSVPAYLMQWRAARYLLPEIRRRLNVLENPEVDTNTETPNDMLQWVINHAQLNPVELEPMNLARRLILFNLFATTTTPTLASTVLIDILSHASAPTLLSTLREEAARIMPTITATPLALREMVVLDPAMRETLRFHPVGSQALMREVMTPGGLTAPASGTFLPRGCRVLTLLQHMHRDAELQGPGADVYDPLRFCRPVDGKQKCEVQVGERYLSFGLGRHACPGRFFAVHAIKLLLGNLLLRYEIEPLEERPKMLEIGDAIVSADSTVVRVKGRTLETH